MDNEETLTASVGDKVTINGQEYTVKGYVDVGNGEQSIIYYRPGWSHDHYCYVDKEGQVQEAGAVDGRYSVNNGPYRELNTENISASGYDKLVIDDNYYNESQVTGQVSVGDKVTINGQEYTVKGYVDVGNGEKRLVYYRPGWSQDHYCYVDKEGQVQEAGIIDGKLRVESDSYDKEIIKDGTDNLSEYDKKVIDGKYNNIITINNNGYYSGGQISIGDKVTIGGEEYTVNGYIDIGDGEKRIVYYRPGWSGDDWLYVDKDGQLKRLSCDPASQQWYAGGFGGTKVEIKKDGTFDPSQSDKDFLNAGNPTYVDETSAAKPGVNYDYDSNSYVSSAPHLYNIKSALVKRKRYYIKYFNQYWQKNGPYDADEVRQVAIETYKKTPGQGSDAYELSKNFQISIGSIRYILEEVADLAKDAIK